MHFFHKFRQYLSRIFPYNFCWVQKRLWQRKEKKHPVRTERKRKKKKGRENRSNILRSLEYDGLGTHSLPTAGNNQCCCFPNLDTGSLGPDVSVLQSEQNVVYYPEHSPSSFSDFGKGWSIRGRHWGTNEPRKLTWFKVAQWKGHSQADLRQQTGTSSLVSHMTLHKTFNLLSLNLLISKTTTHLLSLTGLLWT